MSATYVLTDTVKQSFDAVFAQTLDRVDLQVQGARPLGRGDPQRIPETTLRAVRSVPGVARAEPYVQGYAQFVDDDGESIGGGGPPTFGASWVDDGPFRLVDDGKSRAPTGPGEVAMDAGTASEHGFAVGDRVRVLLDGPAQQFRVVGFFGFGDRDDLGAVTFAAFDLETAQDAFDARGALDGVYVQGEPGVPVRELQARIQQELGSTFEVLTASEAIEQRGEPVRDFLGFFTFALLGFAAIGVVVGAFVIFNTFTILVTQRTRELGLLRAMGATGGQVIGSVVLEALVVGTVASVIGLGVGIVLGVGLLEVLRGVGLQLPETSTVLAGRTVVVSLLVGVVVTVVASLLPAVRAARVPPVAAINAVPVRARGAGLRRRVVTGLAITLLGAVVLVLGLVRATSVSGVFEQVQVVALGAFTLLVGVVVLLAAMARPLAATIGRPLRSFGTSGVLARENAMRNPRRTAVTASALVIGLALVCLTATFGESAKASVRRDTASGLRADYVVKTDGFAGFSGAVAERLQGRPSLDAVVPVRIADGAIGDAIETVGALDPQSMRDVVDLDLVSGDVAGLGGESGGVLLEAKLAERLGVTTGDVVGLQLARGLQPVTVRGVYRNDNFIGIFGQAIPMIVAPETLELGVGGDQQDTLLLVKAAPGEVAAAGATMRRLLADDFPNIEVLTRDEFRDEQLDTVDQFLTVLVAILALSEIIAILGIVNTLALSVFERTRELGLLRIVGMSRRQLRRMVRLESVVIALIGAVVGIVLGLLWGWAFTRSLRDEGLSVFSVPVPALAFFVLGSVVAGVVAAILPAWRASRLDVLDAIATE
jgi:putative ABC transport system permease protein